MRRRAFAALALLLLAAGFASASFLAIRQPLSLGDYLAVWGLKARAIHFSGELSSVFRVDPAGEFSHPEYPPLWPLLLAGAARLLGRYDELLQVAALIQDDATAARLAAEVKAILADRRRSDAMRRELAGIRQKPGSVGWKQVVIGPNPGPLESAEAGARG